MLSIDPYIPDDPPPSFDEAIATHPVLPSPPTSSSVSPLTPATQVRDNRSPSRERGQTSRPPIPVSRVQPDPVTVPPLTPSRSIMDFAIPLRDSPTPSPSVRYSTQVELGGHILIV
jgi:hypothetical protein